VSKQRKRFFDVECANGRAYDFRELSRLLKKAIDERVKDIRVFPVRRPVAGEVARMVIELYDNTTVDFGGIQCDDLDHLGISLLAVSADGSAEALHKPAFQVSPTTIPVTVQLVPPVKRIPTSRRLRPSAA
jgi:hypothetical protein